MQISMVWRGHDMMGLVYETRERMGTLQGKVPSSLARLVHDILQTEWDMKPWNDGWVATRKED